MNVRWFVAVLVLGVASLVPVSGLHAQRYGTPGWDRDITLTCQSQDQRYQLCRVDLGRAGTVRMVERLSKARCVLGESWGHNRAGIWVDRGCRARFVVSRRGGYRDDGYRDDGYRNDGYPGQGTQRPAPGWDGQSVRLTCESQDDRYRMCQIDVGPRGTVRLERQLSNARCIQGQTWGANRAGVWVDRSCRGQFVVDRRW